MMPIAASAQTVNANAESSDSLLRALTNFDSLLSLSIFNHRLFLALIALCFIKLVLIYYLLLGFALSG
jgi:hypothetical protein